MTWHPYSWQGKPYSQGVAYPDKEALDAVNRKLNSLPPLVSPYEIERLKEELVKAGRGKQFILQGGDCAEIFDECRPDIINNKLKILLQMSIVLISGLNKPLVRIGRFAGQYAKPRSSDTETINGVSLPSYRGDIINDIEFSQKARTPNPEKLTDAYFNASATLNFIRTQMSGGFADLHHPENWQLDFASGATFEKRMEEIVAEITKSLDFAHLVAGGALPNLDQATFYVSHEALNLNYESALTHKAGSKFYNLGTHFPWIGMRTAKAGEAHEEYLSGIANPLGIKVGPAMDNNTLDNMLKKLNPGNEEGKIVLIHRFGADQIAQHLPRIVAHVKQSGHKVIWMCDAMHGNTCATENGTKTRDFNNILSELTQAFDIHKKYGTVLGGVHFELTGDDVTECIGGSANLTAEDLSKAYLTRVDPRLNYNQSLEMAFRIVDKVGQRPRGINNND